MPKSKLLPKKAKAQTKPTVHVVFVLDRSGSMSVMGEEPAQGFNAFVDSLREEGAVEYHLSLLQFDNELSYTFQDTKLHQAPLLKLGENYRPRGSTSLLDAMGKAINDHLQHPHVMLAVFTDGQENSSHEFTKAQVKALVEAQTDGGWQFSYLSSDLNAFADAAAYGIAPDMTFKVANNAAGMRSAYMSNTTNVSNYAASVVSSTVFPPVEKEDLSASDGMQYRNGV